MYTVGELHVNDWYWNEHYKDGHEHNCHRHVHYCHSDFNYGH